MPVSPNALATWANAVTVGRLLIAPVLFAVIPDGKGGSWAAFVKSCSVSAQQPA